MSLEYTLANHKDKTCFELGRGSWYALCQNGNRIGHECLLYEDTIYEMIIEEVWDYNISNPENGETADNYRKYAAKIAAELYKFVNNTDPAEISLTNRSDDSTLDLKEKGYRWIGSRYESDVLSELNKHLKK